MSTSMFDQYIEDMYPYSRDPYTTQWENDEVTQKRKIALDAIEFTLNHIQEALKAMKPNNS
jgi:hypothetical protein